MARSEAGLVGVQQGILRKEGRELFRGSIFNGFGKKWEESEYWRGPEWVSFVVG